jgi:histone-lysine N-methyltransferase SETMAR
MQFLAQKSITEVAHPPYSPDLAPNDLWLLPKMKSTLKGQRF